MRSKTVMFYFVFLIVAIGCQPITEGETGPIPPPLLTPIQQSTESDVPLGSPTNRVEIPPTIPIQPTPSDPVEYGTGTPWDKVNMPIFLEVTQTTSMGKNAVQSPAIRVGPAIYFYNPDTKVLMLSPTIKLEPGTELLVGIIDVLQTPDQAFEKREIIQYPSAQPVLIQVVTLEVGTGTLTIFYGDEKFNLSPGENRTFKQTSGGSNISTVITIISNHGHLTEIQPVPSDGSLR